jgi:hypothetical protein
MLQAGSLNLNFFAKRAFVTSGQEVLGWRFSGSEKLCLHQMF